MLAGLSACSAKPKLQCVDAAAQSTATDLVREQIQKAVTEKLRSGDQPVQVLSSMIRATVQQLAIALADIRTTKEDPNSTKRFCTASLRITVPADMLSDAEKARSDAKLTNVSALADENNAEREANAFKTDFEFDVQPTDDGSKVYAESQDLAKVTGFYGELVASSLMKAAIEQTVIQQQQAVSAQQQQQAAAVEEQRAADQAQATTEHDLSTQTITAVWKSLTPEARAALLEDERNWMRKKTADCDVEAASASLDPTEQATARLRCDTKANQARIAVLQQQSGAEMAQ